MSIKPQSRVLRKPICTWVTAMDYQKFHAIADANGVTVAAYLRSMVVDVLVEEAAREPTLPAAPTIECTV